MSAIKNLFSRNRASTTTNVVQPTQSIGLNNPTFQSPALSAPYTTPATTVIPATIATINPTSIAPPPVTATGPAVATTRKSGRRVRGARRGKKFVSVPPGLLSKDARHPSRGYLPYGVDPLASSFGGPINSGFVNPSLGINEDYIAREMAATTTVPNAMVAAPIPSSLLTIFNNMAKGIPPSNAEIISNIETSKKVLIAESQAGYLTPEAAVICQDLYNIMEDIELFLQQKNAGGQWQQVWLNNWYRMKTMGSMMGATQPGFGAFPGYVWNGTAYVPQASVTTGMGAAGPVNFVKSKVLNPGLNSFRTLKSKAGQSLRKNKRNQMASMNNEQVFEQSAPQEGFMESMIKTIPGISENGPFMETWHSMKVLLPLLTSSSEFRSLVSDFFSFLRDMFSQTWERNKKDIGKDLKQDLDEDKDKSLRDTMQETKSKVSEVISGISRDLREGNVPINDAKKEKLQASFRATLKRLSNTPEFHKAIDAIFSLFHSWTQTFDHLGGKLHQQMNQTPQMTQAQIMAKQSFDDFVTILGSFVGERSLQNFMTSLQKLYWEMKSEQEAKAFFKDFKNYVKTMLHHPDWIEQEEHKKELNALWERARQIAMKWADNNLMKRTFSQGLHLLRGIQKDPLLMKTMGDFRKLLNDLAYTSSGNFSIGNFLSTLQSLRFIFVPLILEQLDVVPIPRIERSTPQFDFSIDGAVFYGKSILPENINFQILSSNSINTRQIPAASNQIDLLMTISNFHTTLRNVNFFFRKKTGLFKLADSGLMDIDIFGGQNFFVVRWSIINTPGQPLRFVLSQAYSNITGMKVRFLQAKRRGLLNFGASLFKGTIRNRINRAIELNVANYIARLNLRLNAIALRAFQQRRRMSFIDQTSLLSTSVPVFVQREPTISSYQTKVPYGPYSAYPGSNIPYVGLGGFGQTSTISSSTILPQQNAFYSGQTNVLPTQTIYSGQTNILPTQTSVFPATSSVLPVQTGVLPVQNNLLVGETSRRRKTRGAPFLGFLRKRGNRGKFVPAAPGLAGPVVGNNNTLPVQNGMFYSGQNFIPPTMPMHANRGIYSSQQTGLYSGQTNILPAQQGIYSQQGLYSGQTNVLPTQTSVFPATSSVLPAQTGVLPVQSGLVGETSSRRRKTGGLPFFGFLSKRGNRGKFVPAAPVAATTTPIVGNNIIPVTTTTSTAPVVVNNTSTIPITTSPAVPITTSEFSSTNVGISSTPVVPSTSGISNTGVVIDKNLGDGHEITKISPANLPTSSEIVAPSTIVKQEEITIVPPKSVSASQ